MNDNKNKIIKLKNFNHLEENKTYIYTLKDKDILSDKIEELEILENNFKNKNDKSKINYNIDNQIKKNNKDENDIEIELNEFNEIENINEEIIKKKLMKIKNNNKNEINLNQSKNFEKEFHSIDKFKKKNKKIKFSKILIENDLIDNNNLDIVEENNDKIKTKTEKFSFINNDEKEKLKKIEFRKKKKINNILIDEINDKNIFLNKKINHSNNDSKINNKNLKFLDSINDYSLFLEDIQNDKSTNKNLIKKNNNNNQNDNIDNEGNKKTLFSNNDLSSENKIQQSFSEKNDEIFDEIPTGKGVCSALYILKSRNILKKNEELFGRLKDKSYTTNDYLIKDKDIKKNNEINIEYRGEDGNKLKPREMARYQARIFHGDTTGIKNKEKKMIRKKNLIISSHQQESITQNILNYKQKKERTPFVTIIQKQNNFSSFF